MARLNQSIEAYVYCVLGAQVNARTSILGDFGSAKEAQREFLILMEDAKRQPDISKSIQRFQLAIDEAKVRLDLAISPGTWLMPSNLVLNTQSTVGYNNNLKKANGDVKLGVNSDVNLDMKKVGVRLMNGGPPKIDRPTSHPSNPIHRKSSSSSEKVMQSEKRSSSASERSEPSEKQKQVKPGKENHEILKAGVFIAAAISAFAVYKIF